MAAPKRPHYFQSQLLVVRDFQDEQRYHDELLQQHNRSMHEWGVVRGGLEVKKSGSDSFVIEPGSAIDSLGREIILDKQQTLNATDLQAARRAAGTGQDVFVAIAFGEEDSTIAADKYPPPGGSENVTRKVQAPAIVIAKSVDSDGRMVTLAKIDANNVVSNSVRKIASSFIARGSNLGDISLDGALSFTSKSSPNPNYPQVGLDYDPAKDQLRVRARSQNASNLDLTLLTIGKNSAYTGAATDSPARLDVAGALKLSSNSIVNNDQSGAYFWNQEMVGPTIAGGQFEVRTGGNDVRLRITFGGDVGIGTKDPKSKLHVESTGNSLPNTQGTSQNAGRIVRLKNEGNEVLDIGGAGDKGFWLQSTLPSDLTKNYPLLLNPNGGNVGIGTTDPGAKLEVAGVLKLGTITTFTSDDRAAYFWNQANVGAIIGGFGFEVRTIGNTAKLRIDKDGHVGIGTTAAVARLHVEGSGSGGAAQQGTTQSVGLVARLRGTTDAGTTSPVLDFGSAGAKGFWIQTTNPADLTKNFPLILNPNGGDIGIGANLSIGNSLGIGGSLVIDGNVGVGTRLPISSLHIRKDVEKNLGPTLTLMNGGGGPNSTVHIDLYTYYVKERTDPEARIICQDNGHGTADLVVKTKVKDGETLEERLKIDSLTGEVHVAGSISCGGLITIRSPWLKKNVSARDNSTVTMVTDNDYMEHFNLQMACSRAFKENISDLTALEAITTLQNLTPVKYDYKDQKAFRPNLGFIAEDMPDNLASEDRKSISPFEVVPVLTRVAKEQQRVITELQETVRTLQDAVLG